MRLAAAWSWRLLLVGGVLAVVIFLIVQLRLIVIPLLVAVLLGALLVPFSGFLQRHRWPKWLAITVAMLCALIVSSAASSRSASGRSCAAADELAAQSSWPGTTSATWLLDGPFHIDRSAAERLGRPGRRGRAAGHGVLVSGALSVGSTLGHFLAGMLLALFATLFILIDGRGIWNWIVRHLPAARARRGRRRRQRRLGDLQNFVKVQILVATIDAIGIGLGAFLLGVPLAVPIAILVFLGSFIPIVGAVVTGALAVFVALVYNGLVASR